MPVNADVDVLAGKLMAAVPELDPKGQELGVNLVRLLALGEPVESARLAERVGQPESEVVAELDRWRGVYRDAGRVIGYAGLTVVEMGQHRIHVDGRSVSAWCAYDTLFLPELLGDKTVSVTSRCPVTDREISLTVGPAGVSDLKPADTVVSFLVPDRPLDSDVIQSFCHFVHFFSSPDAAAGWTADHEGTFVMSVKDAFQVGRLVNRARFGHVLAS